MLRPPQLSLRFASRTVTHLTSEIEGYRYRVYLPPTTEDPLMFIKMRDLSSVIDLLDDRVEARSENFLLCIFHDFA